MKKIILIAAMAVISVAATAQNLKFGYVNYTELVQLVPEMDTVREQLEAQEKETYETLGAMYQEYQTKAEQFQQKQSTWTPAIRDSKMKELQEIEARFQESQQIFQQELQQMQQMLQAPVMEAISVRFSMINSLFTSTEQRAASKEVLPSTVIWSVMRALPSLSAVTTPFSSTVATLGLLEDHFKV